MRRSLIALAVLVPFMLPAAFASAMFANGLWRAGNSRCGQEMERYGGYGTGFNGDTDAFVCLVTDAKGRVVARKEVPVKEISGKVGRVPLIPELSADVMEAADSGHWDNR